MSNFDKLDALMKEATGKQEEVVQETTEEIKQESEQVAEVQSTETKPEEETPKEVANPEAKAEEVTEERSLKTNQIKEEVSTDQNQPDYKTYIKEHGYIAGDEYNKTTARIQELEQAAEASKIDNPLISTLIERHNNGAPIDLNFLQLQLSDFDSMSEEDVIMQDLIRQGYSAQDAKDQVKLDYEDIAEYEEDDKEYKKAVTKKRLDANKARAAMKAHQESNKLPESTVSNKAQETLSAQETQREQWGNLWSDALPKVVQEVKDIDLGDGLLYEISDEDKNIAQVGLNNRIVKGNDATLTGLYWDGSNWDTNSLVIDELWRNPESRSRILTKYANELKSEGSSTIIKEIKNTEVETKVEQDETLKSQTDKINEAYEKMAADLKRRY